MGCSDSINSSYSIICAQICEKPNDMPLASFRFENFFLIDTSEFFDSGLINSRKINWKVLVGDEDYVVYDFGWGYYNDLIPDIANGSTYSVFDLGVNNEDILQLLNLLPNTYITNKITFKIVMYVQDCDGIISEISENIYRFNQI